MEAAGIGGVGMKMFLDVIPDRAQSEHDVDERRYQRQQNLEDYNVGQRHPTQCALASEHSAMFINGLQDAKGPAETLAHQAVRVGRSFGISECHVFIFDAIAAA